MSAYVLRRVRPGTVIAIVGGFVVIAVAEAIGVFEGSAWWLWILAGAAALGSAWRSTLVLRIDGSGIRLHRHPLARDPSTAYTDVPWASIHEIALTESDPPELAIRLRSGAPLPDGAHGVIHDPSQPNSSGPDLRLRLPGRAPGRAELAAAVQTHGGIPLRTA